MIRQKILQQLLEWIECNLEHPISIEDIAQKSGYSRRNIQLLFRNFMHVPLGEYIRKRRLCRAAILVRLTAKSMLDIALSLGRCEQVPDMRSSYSSGAHPRGTS